MWPPAHRGRYSSFFYISTGSALLAASLMGVLLTTVLNQDQPTVQLSLATLSSGYYSDYAQIFAGTALATLPLLAVFVLFGRQIIGGIMEGALKA